MKDSRQKYLDISEAFNNRATEIDLYCKQSQRLCEQIAKRLAKANPKNGDAFERVEEMKDFILKTSKANERTIEFIQYVKGLLGDVLEDSKVLIDGAILRDKLNFQSDTILIQFQQQEDQVRAIYNLKKNEISSRNKANP